MQVSIKGNEVTTWRHPKKPACSEYDVTQLWTQKSPTGYFYDDQWTLTHCTPGHNVNHSMCLKRTTIFLYGDSTVKQWYGELQTRLNCSAEHVLENEREPVCWNRKFNIAMYFIRHSLPGNIIDGNIGSRKLEELVEEIQEGTKPVFMMHIYSHYTYYHDNVYRDRIKRLRKSIEIILSMRPDAIFLFKGPHTMYSKYLGVSDYYAYVYRLILMEELEGLHDKIIYLDFKDMSIAKLVQNIHPKVDIVKAMVDEMLAYLC